MSPLLDSASGVLHGILRSSWQAGVLIVLILIMQRLFRGALSPQWRAALWLVLLVRLLMPWTPESRLSVFNMVSVLPANSQVTILPDTAESPVAAPAFAETPPRESMASARPAARPQFSGRRLALGIWVAGVVLAALSILYANLRLMRHIRRISPLASGHVTSLLIRCKAEMGVKLPVSIVITDGVHGPSLVGCIRPRILLPEGLLHTLSPDQLRFIFLHELAHIKRFDILVGWLAAALQAIHWFNPLIWLAFRRMRADRELACDAAVLSHTGDESSDAYGRTIIALLERSAAFPQFTPMAGLAETKTQLERRITMIAQFKKSAPWLSVIAVIILAGLAVVTLTNAVQFGTQTAARTPGESQAETVPPGLPDFVPATSTVDMNGRIVDKMDWPFVDDPAVIGAWKSVDFVRKMDQFEPDKQKWKGDLYLKGITFLPNGRTQQVWRWTKGLVLHDGDRTAAAYEIKTFNGEPYMFFEWKSGDYSIRKTKPQYYVLKKDRSAPIPKAEGMAAMSDEAFSEANTAAVAALVYDINNVTRERIAEVLGEPIQYVWGDDVFKPDSLPENYIMQYPDRVDFWIANGTLVEARFYHPGYSFIYGIQVGSTLDEVQKALGPPTETLSGQKNEFQDGVLYQDINGRKGYCYYQRKDKGVRCFFIDYNVNALYITSNAF